MKILCISSRENWIDDRIASEFKEHSQHEVSFNDVTADAVWLVAPWIWKSIPRPLLMNKKLVCTIHHQVPEKFDEKKLQDFKERDQYVDFYHVPCEKTKSFVSKITQKPIKILAYWYNQSQWRQFNKEDLRKKWGFINNELLIASFQRDSEGANPQNPKLEKGPDLFFKYVSRLNSSRNVHVLLAGWRRKYLINKLEQAKIPHTYRELADQQTLNELYSLADFYIIASRCEGGPQALLESPACGTPVVSTDVGMAQEILPNSCIINAEIDEHIPNEKDLHQTIQKITPLEIQNQIINYDLLFSSL